MFWIQRQTFYLATRSVCHTISGKCVLF